LADEFEHVYKRRFNDGETKANVIDTMDLHGGYGVVKTDEGKLYGFIPPDKGSKEELRKRFNDGEWQGY